MFNDLSEVHLKLGEAVVAAEEGEIVGYEDIYSKDARTSFLVEVTNQCEDAMELLDAKIEILRNLEHLTEVNSVFNTGSSETIQRINDWGNDSRLEEFHQQDFDRRPPREERPSHSIILGVFR